MMGSERELVVLLTPHGAMPFTRIHDVVRSSLCRIEYSDGSSAAQRHHLPAVGDNGRAGDEASSVGGEQQERTVEIALLAETADRNLALELHAVFARQIVA